ncbi:glycosyltransferase, partial [Patescibacteria group bacterium]|nr:glycosyltransferase [Patescibacteria group bacterium]
CDALFTGGIECVYFDNDQDLANKLAGLLSDETTRNRISDAACERAHREHTWEQRLRPHVERWMEAVG